MTRFWITLDQAVDFIFKSFQRMQGGEVFVPKIPSIRVLDLANAMDPDMPLKEVGTSGLAKSHELFVLLTRIREHLNFLIFLHWVLLQMNLETSITP